MSYEPTTEERSMEVEKAIHALCEEVSVPVVCAIAATYCDWFILIPKADHDEAYVDGMSIGTREFINRIKAKDVERSS